MKILASVLYEAGITGLGKNGFPSALNSSDVEPDKISYLLINAIETEPYLTGPKTLLHEEFEKFVTGIKVLKGALGNVEVHVGLELSSNLIFLKNSKIGWSTMTGYSCIRLLPKYPQGEDEVSGQIAHRS